MAFVTKRDLGEYVRFVPTLKLRANLSELMERIRFGKDSVGVTYHSQVRAVLMPPDEEIYNLIRNEIGGESESRELLELGVPLVTATGFRSKLPSRLEQAMVKRRNDPLAYTQITRHGRSHIYVLPPIVALDYFRARQT